MCPLNPDELIPAPDAAVCAVLLNERGQVLLVSRRHDTTRWGLPGGKVDPGESHLQSIVRECAEEVGVALQPLLLEPVFCRLVPKGPGPNGRAYWVTTFVSRQPVASSQVLTPEPGLVVRWADAREVLQDEHGPFADYNKGALAAVSDWLASTMQEELF